MESSVQHVQCMAEGAKSFISPHHRELTLSLWLRVAG